MKNKDLLLNVSKIPSIEEQINDNQYDVSKLNNYLGGIYNNKFNLFKGIINNNTYSTVINDVPIRYFNLDKTLDGLTLFDTLFVNIRYTKDNVEKTYNSYTSYDTNFNCFNIIMNSGDFSILIKIIPDKQINENFEEVVAEGKSYFYIKYTKTTTEETRNMLDNAYIELIVSNNNILKMDNTKVYTPTGNYNPATKKYVDDKAIVEQIPILRVDESNKIVYVNCNEMGTYKKYFVPNKYANVYSFPFIYTNDDNTETEIVRVGGALTKDDFVLCSKNTSSQLVLVLGNHDKYTYTKSTKAITKGIYGYLAIGNTLEYTPTHDYHPSTKKYVDDTSKELQIDNDFRTAIAYNQAAAIKNASIIIFDNKLSDNISYNVDPDYSDENNKIQGKCAININKTLDAIGVNDILSVVLKYKVNGEYNIFKSRNKVSGTTGAIRSTIFNLANNNKIIFQVYANRKINSDFTETEDTNYCAILIAFAYTIPVETITEIRDSLELYVDLCSLNTLTLDNKEEFTPTSDYHPATKKYVDDKKYNDLIEKPITVLPYETTVSNDVVYKNSAINVATLEGHKIYMTAPDVTNLFLQVEKLDGTLIGELYFLAKSSGSILLQTGFKNDKKIEIMIEGTVHTFYFKTDTEEPRVERTVRYLTSNNTVVYTPTSDYHPSTKKYVDDTAETLVKKDTNKYKLITSDDPLVITKSDITDDTEATISIDNLTGQFGNLTANEDNTWTYTLNGFMNGLEIFTFTVGETTQDLVIAPYKEMVYNDNNTEIVYNGTWDVENDTKYSNGSAHKTSQKGAKATFTFTGTGVNVYTRTNGAVGLICADLYSGEGAFKADGTYKPTLKTHYIDNATTSGDYYQIPTLSFENLDYGTYTVVITAGAKGQGSEGTYYLDGVRVYNPLDNINLKINDLYRLEEKQNNFLHTDRKNAKYTPTHDYDPSTKKYVDDTITEQISSSQATDEEVDTMLQTVLGGDYSNE